MLTSMDLGLPNRAAAATLTETTPTPTPTPTITPLPTFAAKGPLPRASTWSKASMFSNPNQMGWFADIAADQAGGIYVVWASGLSTKTQQVYDVVLFSKTDDGTDWTKHLDIAGKLTEGSSTRPSILIDPSGMLHLTYHVSSIYYTHFPALAVQANNAPDPLEISLPKVGYFSRLAIDSKERVHVLFTQNAFDINCEECFHVYYRWSDDKGKTWSNAVDLSQMYNATKAWLLVDKMDNLQVVWEAALGSGQSATHVFHIASYDGGVSWSSPTDFVTIPNSEGRQINIAQDDEGNLLVVWLELPENRVYFNISDDAGKTWSTPMVVPHVFGGWYLYPARFDTYSLATDGDGNIHLGMVGRSDRDESSTSLSVLELVWNGTGWSDAQAVSTLEGDVPEWPRLVVANGNKIYMTWFVRKASDIWTNHTTNRIWYAHGVADAASIQSQPLPTLTASATATTIISAKTSTPTPSGVADIATTLSPIENRPLVYSEKEYLLYAGISLLPVLLLVGGVYGIVTLWRQRR